MRSKSCCGSTPPAQVSGRQATADFDVAGVTIRRGDNIGLDDRGRQPGQAPLGRMPTTCDSTGPTRRPISFGFGAHHCLGAALARMELRTRPAALLDTLGDYTVDSSEDRGSDPSHCVDQRRCS